MDYKHWVVGFLFKNRTEIALMLKTHPEFQKGKLNGIGGRIEDGESAIEAMRREFAEEAGVDVPEWREFALLKEKIGDVTFFVAHGDYAIKSMTEEQVGWYSVDTLRDHPVMPDLLWLVPLALNDYCKYATIDYDQPM